MKLLSPKVVIIGGEMVGCETPDFPGERGSRVTVVRRGSVMASKMFASNRRAQPARLNQKDVTLITGAKEYQAIIQDGLGMNDGKGQRIAVEAETIVLATGAIPNNELANALKSKVSEIRLVGDCAEPGRIRDAVHDGALAGLRVWGIK
ncbi:MAG: FAD-dependent oxidoreductase [Chloroflexi bacterium]|nr:FAD-dependent oxidoreductase [Chloroflexota bacterium]